MQNRQNSPTLSRISLQYHTPILSALCMYAKDLKKTHAFYIKVFSSYPKHCCNDSFCMSHAMFLVYNSEDYQKYHKKYFSTFGKLKFSFSLAY